MRLSIASITVSLLAVAACDKAYDPGQLAIDPNAPRVAITSPALGTIAGDVKTVEVTGTATDDGGIATVTVNGTPATVTNGTFTATVPVWPGTNLLEVVATDTDGNTGKSTRAVSAGEVHAFTDVIPDAIMASISAQTFDAVSQGATQYVRAADLTAMIAPHNPVIVVGGTDPDCLYAHGAITGMTLGQATTISLAPMAGGLYLDATLDAPLVKMHFDYAAACVDGSRDVTAGAAKIHVAGLIAVGVDGDGKLTTAIQNPDVTITSLDLELGGLPGDVVDLIHLDTALGPIIGWATERFVAPMIAQTIQGAASSTTSVLGQTVDINLTPSRLDFDVDGAVISMNSQLRAEGDSLLQGYVYTDNLVPHRTTTDQGFEIAVADDAANELLASLWSAKAFEQKLALNTGDYGDVGKLYDSVELSVAVPPFLTAGSDGLVLTIGDLGITFKNGNQVATKVMVNAKVALTAKSGADGKLRLDAGQPTVDVDLLDDGVEGANDLSQPAFEQVVSFALSRAVSFGSGAVGAIPLPSAGGVGVTNLAVKTTSGYLLVDGAVQ